VFPAFKSPVKGIFKPPAWKEFHVPTLSLL
jgi:hypothetical protein